jgi:Transport and Golgi organisation 2
LNHGISRQSMCSVVILRRPGHDWPVIFAANRDEMNDRAWLPPGRHWPDRPQVVAGLDQLAGGSWLGLNDHGLIAGVMNRVRTLGPSPGKRSRGELVLEALDHADASEAAAALARLEPAAYRPFNLVLADNRAGFWLHNDGARIAVEALPPGLSMITAHDRNDAAGSRRIRHFLPLFAAAPAPEPAADDWRAWQALLASRAFGAGGGPHDAMTILGENGFETLSSALIALPAAGLERPPIWRFAAGRPDRTPYLSVAM